MQEAITRRRDKLFTMGENMRPMVVLVGQLDNVQSAYVVLDDYTWKLQSALKAVDLCFKAYHVLHSAYCTLLKLMFGICCRKLYRPMTYQQIWTSNLLVSCHWWRTCLYETDGVWVSILLCISVFKWNDHLTCIPICYHSELNRKFLWDCRKMHLTT